MALAGMVIAHSATAQTTWLGTGPNWNLSTNWSTGTAGPASYAVFNTGTAFAFQPQVPAAATVEGIWVTGSSGAPGVTTTISGLGILTISGSATLNGIASLAILLDGSDNNSLTIANSFSDINFSKSSTFLVNNGGTLTVATALNLANVGVTVGSSVASGSGAVILSGNNLSSSGISLNDTAGSTSLLLSGSNSYTGGTVDTSGSMTLSGIINGSAITVSSGASAGAFVETSTGVISGSLGFGLNGFGSAILSGTNSYSGATTVSGGTLTLQGANTATSGTTSVSGSGVLLLDSANNNGLAGGVLNINGGQVQSLLPSTVITNTVSLGGSGTVSGAQSITFTGPVSEIASESLASDIAPGSGTLTLAGTVNIDSVTNTSLTLTISGTGNTIISGTIEDYSGGIGLVHGNLIITNTGTTTLAAANTFGGTTTLNGGFGVLMLGNSLALQNSVLSLTSGTLGSSVAGLTLAGLAGSGNLTPAGSLTSITLGNNNGINPLYSGTIANGTGGALSLTKIGTNTQILSGSNSYTGATTISSGTLQIGNGSTTGQLSTGSVIVDNGALDFDRSSLVTQGTDFSGAAISGTGSVFQIGTGTLTLTANNTYSGSTTVNSGNLLLDFSQASGPTTASNIVSGSSALVMGSGTLIIKGGGAGATNSQTFASTTFQANTASSLVFTQNSATSLSGTLGALNRNAQSTANLVLPATGSLVTSSTNFASGSNNVLTSAATSGVAFMTVGGTTWATNNSGTIGALATYSTGAANYLAGNNVNVTNGDSVTGVTVNTLRFSGSAEALTLSGSNTVSTGGILVASSGTGSSITGGTISGGGGQELVLIDNGSLNISSVIADSSSGQSGFTLAGSGTTTLGAANTFTGTTELLGGTLILGNALALQNSVLQMNAGSANFGSQTAITLGGLGGTQNLALASTLQSLTLGNSNGGGAAYSGVLSGSATVTKTGSNTQTLSGANTFTGSLVLNSGTLVAINNATALGAGVSTLALAGGSLDLANASGASLSFGRNTTVTGNSTIISDLTSGSVGNTYTLGTLSIGAQTLSVDGGASAVFGTAGVTFGAVTLTNSATFNVVDSVNGGTTLLSLAATSLGANNLTVTGNGNVSFGTSVINGSGAVVTGTGFLGTVIMSGDNSFAGGLTVNSGTVEQLVGSATDAFGAGAISLGSAGSSGTATLEFGSVTTNTTAISNALALGSGATGLLIDNTTADSVFFTGAIALNGGNLILDSLSGALQINPSSLSGSGNVTSLVNSGFGSEIGNVSVNFSGSLINTGTGSGTFELFKSGLGSNIAILVQNDPNGNFELNGGTNSAFGGLVLVESGSLELQNNGPGALGTGTVTLGTANSNVSASIDSENTTGTSSITNPTINLAQNDTGTLTLGNFYTGAGGLLIISSTINLDGDTLTFLNGNSLGANITGNIVGSGNFIYQAQPTRAAPFTDSGNFTNVGSIQIGNQSGAGLAFSGLVNTGTIESIGSATFSGTLSSAGFSNLYLGVDAGVLTVSNAITGSTAGLVENGGAFLTDSAGQSYGTASGTVVLSGSGATYTGQNQVLSGVLELSGGTSPVYDSWLGQGTDPILVGDTSGAAFAELLINAANSTLNRSITIRAGSGGDAVLAASSSGTFGGAIALNKSVDLEGSTSVFKGAITTGASAPGAVSVIKAGIGGNVILSGTNSYNGGTVVASGVLQTGTSASLGSGNAVVEGGVLRSTSTGSASVVAAGADVYVGAYGMVSSGDLASISSEIDSNSSGAIGIEASQSAGPVNLASYGNGNMWFGADGSAFIYSGSLGANADGNYRLGWGGVNLSVTGSLTNSGTGSSQLIVGGTAGKTNPLSLSGGDNFATQGTVTIAASQGSNYAGGTVVNSFSTLIGNVPVFGGSPFGSATGSMTLHNATVELVNNGTVTTTTTVGALSFDGSSQVVVSATSTGTTTFALGAITRNDYGTLTISPAGTGGVLGSTAIVTSVSGTSLPTSTVATSAGTTIAMVAPYIFDASGDYLTYSTTTGFTPITTTFTNPDTTGTNDAYVKTAGVQNISNSDTIGALSLTGSLTNLTSGSDVTLTISSGGLLASGSSVTTIWVGNSTPTEGIYLNFGGTEAVINTGANNVVLWNAVTANGLTKTGGGILALQAFINGVVGTDNISGTVTVNGGWLAASGTVLGTYTATTNTGGTITANFYGDSALGTANILLNGGGLSSAAAGGASGGVGSNGGAGTFVLSAGRTIFVGPDGGSIGSFNQENSSANNTIPSNLVINSLISGTGAYLNFGAVVGLNNVYQGPSYVILTNTGNNFSAPINVYGQTNLLISNEGELGDSGTNSNMVTLDGGNAVLQYGSAGVSGTTSIATGVVLPTVSGTITSPITFLNQGGGIDVVQPSGTSVTLTLTGSITGDGMFQKLGNGTLVLTATSGNSFEGSIIIRAGILSIDDGTQLGLTTGVVTGTNLGAAGVSGNASSVLAGGELDINNTSGTTMLLGGTGGKTLDVSGTGAGGGGAINNLSGTNSDSGQVILEANSMVNVAANSELVLSGSVSDGGNGYGLTQNGAGTLFLSGTNSWAGGTVVNRGMLEASGTSALPNLAQVTVNSGAILAVQTSTGGTGAGWSAANVGTLLTSATFNAGSALGVDTTNGNFTYGSSITGSQGLTKLGSNALILSAVSSYTGATTVNAGSLLVASTGGLASSPVAVSGNGTLGAGGSASGGSTLSTLNLVSLTLNTNSTLSLYLDPLSTNADLINTGTLTLNGGAFNFTLTASSSSLTGPEYTLLTWANTGLSGIAGDFSVNFNGSGTLPTGYVLQEVDGSSGSPDSLELVAAAVPEPRIWVLMGLGAFMVFGVRHPRRRKIAD